MSFHSHQIQSCERLSTTILLACINFPDIMIRYLVWCAWTDEMGSFGIYHLGNLLPMFDQKFRVCRHLKVFNNDTNIGLQLPILRLNAKIVSPSLSSCVHKVIKIPGSPVVLFYSLFFPVSLPPLGVSWPASSVNMVESTIGNTIGAAFLGILGSAMYAFFFRICFLREQILISYS